MYFSAFSLFELSLLDASLSRRFDSKGSVFSLCTTFWKAAGSIFVWIGGSLLIFFAFGDLFYSN